MSLFRHIQSDGSEYAAACYISDSDNIIRQSSTQKKEEDKPALQSPFRHPVHGWCRPSCGVRVQCAARLFTMGAVAAPRPAAAGGPAAAAAAPAEAAAEVPRKLLFWSLMSPRPAPLSGRSKAR